MMQHSLVVPVTSNILLSGHSLASHKMAVVHRRCVHMYGIQCGNSQHCVRDHQVECMELIADKMKVHVLHINWTQQSINIVNYT